MKKPLIKIVVAGNRLFSRWFVGFNLWFKWVTVFLFAIVKILCDRCVTSKKSNEDNEACEIQEDRMSRLIIRIMDDDRSRVVVYAPIVEELNIVINL